MYVGRWRHPRLRSVACSVVEAQCARRFLKIEMISKVQIKWRSDTTVVCRQPQQRNQRQGLLAY